METGAAQSKLGREAELNIYTLELMSSPSAISERIDSPQTLTRLDRPARSPEGRIHSNRRPLRPPEAGAACPTVPDESPGGRLSMGLCGARDKIMSTGTVFHETLDVVPIWKEI